MTWLIKTWWRPRYRWRYLCVFLEEWTGDGRTYGSTTGKYVEFKIWQWWYLLLRYRTRRVIHAEVVRGPRPVELPRARIEKR